jgi:hypothetical protein
MPKEDDIRDVRSEQEQRGKRPIDAEEKKRIARLREKFYDAMRSGNEKRFEELLTRDLEQKPGSEQYVRSWQAWKKYHGER